MSKDTDLTVCIKELLQFRDEVQIYHWMTTTHSRHVASDKLYTKLNAVMDSWVEAALGGLSKSQRPGAVSFGLSITRWTDSNASEKVSKFKTEMMSWKLSEPGIRHLREELAMYLDQALYLFSQK